MMKYLIFLLCYHALMVDEIAAFGSMGPTGKIIVNSIYDCIDDDKPTGDEIKLEVKLVDDNGEKAIDVVFEPKIDIDDNLNYKIDIKKFEGGSWKTFYNVKGKPCKDLDRYIKKLWSKLTASVEPKLDQSCPIPAGAYKINKFQAETEDIEIKTIFYGKLLLKITVEDKDGKSLMCIMGEGDSQAPS